MSKIKPIKRILCALFYINLKLIFTQLTISCKVISSEMKNFIIEYYDSTYRIF